MHEVSRTLLEYMKYAKPRMTTNRKVVPGYRSNSHTSSGSLSTGMPSVGMNCERRDDWRFFCAGSGSGATILPLVRHLLGTWRGRGINDGKLFVILLSLGAKACQIMYWIVHMYITERLPYYRGPAPSLQVCTSFSTAF